MRRIGRITITEEMLLRMLDFEGGRILDSRKEWVSEGVDFIIAHADMPNTPDNQRAADVPITYSQTDLGGVITIHRQRPPKASEE